MTAIVTAESLIAMINAATEEKRQHIIGRALCALFERQTREEQASNDTKAHNSIGFNGPDAKSGSITAKFYIKNNRLEPWMVERWLSPSGRSGKPRIVKYARQLNEIALAKAARLTAKAEQGKVTK